jgi:hypothetical protein
MEPTLDYDNLSPDDAEKALDTLMSATINVGLEAPTWGRKLWPYQDGRSPTLIANQAHIFIEELHNHTGNSTRQ